MEFLPSFLRRHFAGKPPVTLRNIGFFGQWHSQITGIGEGLVGLGSFLVCRWQSRLIIQTSLGVLGEPPEKCFKGVT